jgi:hypothetical protein
MKTIAYIKFGVLVLRHIVQGIIGYFWNMYKMFQFVKLISALNKWPEDIKVPLVIAVIDKE